MPPAQHVLLCPVCVRFGDVGHIRAVGSFKLVTTPPNSPRSSTENEDPQTLKSDRLRLRGASTIIYSRTRKAPHLLVKPVHGQSSAGRIFPGHFLCSAAMKVNTTPSTSTALSAPIDVSDIFATGALVPARPQQVDCVKSVCAALHDDCKAKHSSNYLIQHATGSGKSLTIAALAHTLTRFEDAQSNRVRLVVIIADRKALEEQVGGVVGTFFDAHGDSHLVDRAESCAHLRQLLLADTAGNDGCRVVVTTFQKALGRGTEASDADDADDATNSQATAAEHTDASVSSTACMQPRVVILADEAHRSHGHSTTASLHALLCGGKGQPRHISYVSFTATPSEVSLRLFGVANHATGVREPFHCFSLRQALAAGLCVDVLSRYTTARPSASVADSHGRPRDLDTILAASTKRGASTRALLRAAAAHDALLASKARGALDFVCKAIAEAEAAGMDDPKAMMVVRSRQHCAAYRRALLRLLAERSSTADAPPERENIATAAGVRRRLGVYVAFSGTLTETVHGDGDRGGSTITLSERTLNGGEVLSLFRSGGPALLIVCAKLETGFDEPRVCCMVVDRVLRGAHAVQVLGRANRVAPHKPPPRVLDFANTSADIAAAFRGFLGASRRAICEQERQTHLGRELAHISAQLLERIADRSISLVAAEAVADHRVESLVASVEEYVQGCETLNEEIVQLPYGYATRLLTELRTSSSSSAATASSGRTDSGGVSNGIEQDGSGGTVAGGYCVSAGSVATTFSGRIPIDGEDTPDGRPRTRPLSHANDLSLGGAEGALRPLSAAVEAATALAERVVRALLVAPPSGAAHTAGTAQGVPQAYTIDELQSFDKLLRDLAAGRGPSVAEGQAHLLQAYHRPPPTVNALRATKAGASVKAVARHHRHATIVALASALMARWKAAAEAEERRHARAAALQLPSASTLMLAEAPPAKASVDAQLEAKEDAPLPEPSDALADPMRQTAACHLAEALQAAMGSGGEAAGRDGALAARIERALFDVSGGTTGKQYRSRARALCSSLRAARGAGLCKRLREGELSAAALCGMDERTLAEAMLSEDDRAKRDNKRQREARAIESIRIENMGDASDEYKCGECKGRRCALFHTNSMGAVHLTSVPDMIIQCLDCNHRFTL